MQLAQNRIDQAGHRGTTGFDRVVRRFAVQRVALGKQIAQAGHGVGHLQQGPLAVVTQAAHQVFRLRLQVHHGASGAQDIAVGGAQDSAAARGQHARRLGAELGDHLLLDIAKAVLAFPLKKFPYGAAQPQLDGLVRIQKRQLQAPGKVPADSGFARTWEADEDDQKRFSGVRGGCNIKTLGW